MEKTERVLISDDRKRFFFKGTDIHTKYGFVKKEDVLKAKLGSKVNTQLGKEFTVISPSFIDKYMRIKRGPQIIPLKDLGMFISETGLEPNWKIVDAGSGSGALACFLANLVPKGKVYTYDIRDDHLAITHENIKFLGLKNITAKQLDIYKSIPHKNMNMVTLDLPEPWLALENCVKALISGGFILSYSPCIPQVSDFVEKVKKTKSLMYLKTIELIEREWEFEERKIRPKTQQIGHSGFLSLVRKI